MVNALDAYCASGNRQVQGWLLPAAIEAIRDLADLQRRAGIAGPVCEIGVHHGRLFILLHLLSAAGERGLAVDLFENQAENVDQSGLGSREAFEQNLRRHGGDASRVRILAANSLCLGSAQIIELCSGRPRLFSIDGGHTAEATRNDLGLAATTVCDGGAIILDDYFNADWPAVSEGTCAFMRQGSSALVPVAITGNKFLFTTGPEAARTYLAGLRERHPFSKLSTVFGHEVLCIQGPTARQRLSAHPAWRRLRQTPLGSSLREAARRAGLR